MLTINQNFTNFRSCLWKSWMIDCCNKFELSGSFINRMYNVPWKIKGRSEELCVPELIHLELSPRVTNI